MPVVTMTSREVESTAAEAPSAATTYHQLLLAAKRLVPCDAMALLRLDDGILVPVAVDGLSVEALGRRFVPAAHPRLARALASASLLRFAPDCGLPDPYDGLVADHPELLAVHDCAGVPVRVDGRLWGLLTIDALAPRGLGALDDARVESMLRLLESGVAAIETIAAMEERALREQERSRAWQTARMAPRELLGTSRAMQQLRDEIETVAASELTVLLLGETGVGKDLVAQGLHARSFRRDRPLVQVNCAALPETLADSELFGHKKGAFTGAVQDRVGKFELADGGTLFLDEVGELPLAVQAKLLRVLQSGDLQRPGSDRLRKVDVRVIAATNRDLRAAIAQGRFRADLYHRLAVYPLHVPPLRERGRDVLSLAGSFLEENQQRLGARNLRLTPAAKEALLAHRWPGNVRELEHVLSRAALRAINDPVRSGRWVAIEVRHLGVLGSATAVPPAPAALPEPAALPGTTPSHAALEHSGPALGLRAATDAFQRRWIAASLQRHGGQLARAAREAGMDRSNFHRLARRLGVLPGRDSAAGTGQP
jgi:anaerobic nitric oxide reductase transcription regulator